MAGMKFTPDQQQVIDTRNRNLLVSAAAGSGKTAVLVERIIQMITDKEKPVDIDRLLVVTFTSAAAAEMRERISLAIEERLYEEPENEHLQKQAALLHNAQITTIDSFCLFVIRNNFNDIGLDPAFRVADEGEIRLMKQDAMEELFEECFLEPGERFTRLVEAFGKSGSEKPLAEQVQKLYEFSMSLPWPKEWLLARKKDYCLESQEEMDDSELAAEIKRETLIRLKDAEAELARAIRICEKPDGPYMYAEMLESDLTLLKELEEAAEAGLETAYRAINGIKFSVLSRKRDESVNVARREQVKNIRAGVKDTVQELRETYFYKSPQEQLADMQHTAELVDDLIDVTLRFGERFSEKKREKNVIDFSDMEHFALDILVCREDGLCRPTEAAVEYRRHFAEILMDEYQDSNLVQEALMDSISGEPEGRFNRFMVGDVKQSIYRFRLARPELFLEKYKSYGRDCGESCLRIDLKKNFRSRGEVLESVNFVFSRIMQQKFGGVEYDADAALYPGAVFPEGEQDYQTELLLYDRGEEESGQEAREKEAQMIAGRIREMVGHFPVTDKQTGKQRPAEYRDMVILLRTNSGWDDVFLRVLSDHGIPAYAASKTGYFAASEVQTLLQLLKVIDNPRQDIPLFGVLKSLFGGFTEEELAFVRAKQRNVPGGLYEELEQFEKEYAAEAALPEQGQNAECSRELSHSACAKWGAFKERLNRYRKMVCYMPVGKLIRAVLQESGYLYAVSAMPGGEQRRANVEMLLARAADFEKTSYYGLFHFLRYIEQMERYQIDYGEASILDENADTVRLMSIHKSKGLEFPICFVAGLSKAFNRTDSRETLLLDVDDGIGAEYVDLERRFRQNTLRKNVMRAHLKKESLGEELRVLYVAMTRAKEKLILTASVEEAEKQLSETPALAEERMSYGALLSAGSFLDLLLPCVLDDQHVIRLTVMSGADLEVSGFRHSVKTSMLEKRLLFERECREDTSAGRAGSETLQKQLAFIYPHENLRELYTKSTVSELKKAGHEDFYAGAADWYPQEEIVPLLPRFLQDEKTVSGTDRGSAYHRVMELLDFCAFEEMPEAAWEKEIDRQIGQMEETGRLSTLYRESVRALQILRFLKSSLAGRMMRAQKAGKLRREKPFVMGIPASRLRASFPEEEMVLVQGIIDVWFEEEDGLVVADYKTDRIRTGKELTERYALQLDYYAEALKRITGKEVKEKILYSFALQEEIRL